ncbi:MAG: hypothetical protein ACK41F_04260 [Fimbriimonadaceae bacterium]
MTRFEIRVPDRDLDLPLCVSCGQVFRWRQVAEGVWAGVDGDDGYVCRRLPDGWEVSTNADEASFRRLFRLDRRLAEVEANIVGLAPELAPYVARLPGLRLMRPRCAREVLFSFLCTSNNNLERITKMVRWLGDLGDPIEGLPVRAFPPLERLARLDEAELRRAGFGYRARTIVAVARKLMELGEDWLHGMRRVGYEEAHASLRGLPGVGPKVADCVCLIGLHFDEAAPIDTHLWQAACRLFFPEWAGKALTEARYRQVGRALRERFGPLTGWAHQYLFYDNLLRWRSRGSAERADTLAP